MKLFLTQKLAAIVVTLALTGCVRPPGVEGFSPGEVVKECDVCPEMVVIPSGSFQMGASDDVTDEQPVHPVNIKSFLMGMTEVTRGQWKAVMGSYPLTMGARGDGYPVEWISWHAAHSFIQKLNTISGKQYRLASEAEWEYAARAGNKGQWGFGDDQSDLPDYAWSDKNSGGNSRAVGQKQANAFGLYDMHGNMWEWVEDCWHGDYSGALSDGSAWTTGWRDNFFVLRGG